MMPPTTPPPDFPPDEVRTYLEQVIAEWRTLRPDRVPLEGVYTLLQARQRPTHRPREGQDDPQRDLAAAPEPRQGAAGLLRDLVARREPGEAPREAPPPPPVPLREALRQARFLVLVGEPGAGKSTTLQYLGLVFACAARQTWEAPAPPDPCGRGNFGPAPLGLEEQRIPFLLRLPELKPAEPQAVEAALRRAWQKFTGHDLDPATLAQWRNQGRLLVLLDGLDEVPENAREKVREALRTFRLRAEGCRVVVATRPAGYTSLPEPFRDFTLQPLNPQAGQDFLRRWVAARRGLPPDDPAVAGDAAAAWKILMDRPALQRLALTPLTLKMLAEVVAEQGPQALAAVRGRADLYERYVTQALWQRAQARGAHDEDRAWALALLEAWAWARQVQARRTEADLRRTWEAALWTPPGESVPRPLVPPGDPAAWERARRLVRRQLGLLLAQGAEWAFTHLTWQEYFVARRLARAWRSHRETTWRFLRPRLHHPDWQEVLLLLAGLLEKAKATDLVRRVRRARSPYEGVLFRDRRLAARMVGEGARVDEKEVAALVRDLTRPLDRWRRLTWLARHAPRWLQGWLGHIRDTAVRALRAVALVEGQDEALAALMRALGDGDPWVRWAAVEALGQMGRQPEVVAALARALGDEVEDVRWAAVEALGQMEPQPEVVAALVRALGDTDWRANTAAVEALGQMGPQPEVVAALVRALEDADMREAAAWALEQMGPGAATEEVVAALMRALRDGEPWVRGATAKVLGRMGPQAATEEVVAALMRTLEDADVDVREAAAWALGQVGPGAATAEVVSALMRTLEDADGQVRAAAAEALGKMGPLPEVVSALMRALGDADWWVRAAAAQALGRMGPQPRVLAALVRALGDEDEYVRWAADWALGLMGPEAATAEVVAALARALGDADEDVRRAAVRALGQMGPEAATAEVAAALVRALGDEDEYVRRATAEALGQMGPQPEVVAALVRALGDEAWWVRAGAAWALGLMGPGAATEAVLAALVQALGDEDWPVRAAAAQALGRMGPGAATAEVVAALVRALGDAEPWVCWAAAQVLGDADEDVREAAAQALGQMAQGLPTLPGARRVARALWWRLTDWSAGVREAAYRALEAVATRLTVLQVAALPPLDPLQPPPLPRWRLWLVGALVGAAALLLLALAALFGLLGEVLSEVLSGWLLPWLRALPRAVQIGLFVGAALLVSGLPALAYRLWKRRP